MKTALALFGATILCMALAGSFGIGHFRLYYVDEPLTCTKDKT